MNFYLLDVTFYANSDAPEDTDRGLYIMQTEKKATRYDICELFRKVNDLLNNDDMDNSDGFPYSYYVEGINIDTLIQAVSFYTKSQIKKANGYSGIIHAIYSIDVWQ